MSKIKKVEYKDEDTGLVWHQQFLYWCEGCGWEHAFALTGTPWNGHHQFNGDLDNPTVSPSLLQHNPGVCHSFIKDGMIQYLGDCHHDLKNQTVELKDVDEILEARFKKEID